MSHKAHRTNAKGQLKSLDDRLPDPAQLKRTLKVAARHYAVDTLQHRINLLQAQINLLGQLTVGFQRLTFWQRVKWVILGRVPWKITTNNDIPLGGVQPSPTARQTTPTA